MIGDVDKRSYESTELAGSTSLNTDELMLKFFISIWTLILKVTKILMKRTQKLLNFRLCFKDKGKITLMSCPDCLLIHYPSGSS